ncbi:helix-turn-helix domain-containing protein [Paraburkholderia bengalensis]|uniref:Helix-turn-helix domain-containing protein n=1 Tax=Paraburkholderia bengalensis TaxID=2747562 RepID=A0ABU8IJR0_9BURK
MITAGKIERDAASHPRPAVTRRIALVLSEGCDLLAASTVAEVLAQANVLSERLAAGVRYEVHHLSARGGHVRCAASLRVSTQALHEFSGQRPDYVLFAGGDRSENQSDELVRNAWLQRMRNSGSTIRLIGAAPDAHLAKSTSTLRTIPGLQTPRDRVLSALRAVFDITCAGLGDEQALEAIRLATGEHDHGAGFGGVKSAADKVHSATRWLRENCHRPVSVMDVADACAMSERSLLRHFQTYLKTTPSDYLQRVRLERGCEMLTHTSLPADKIARRVGLNNGDRFGKILRRVTGMTPTEYRAATQQSIATDEGRQTQRLPLEVGLEPKRNAASLLHSSEALLAG